MVEDFTRGVFGFVEVVHVELANEGGEVAVLEVFGQGLISEFGLLFYDQCRAIFPP